MSGQADYEIAVAFGKQLFSGAKKLFGIGGSGHHRTEKVRYLRAIGQLYGTDSPEYRAALERYPKTARKKAHLLRDLPKTIQRIGAAQAALQLESLNAAYRFGAYAPDPGRIKKLAGITRAKLLLGRQGLLRGITRLLGPEIFFGSIVLEQIFRRLPQQGPVSLAQRRREFVLAKAEADAKARARAATAAVIARARAAGQAVVAARAGPAGPERSRIVAPPPARTGVAVPPTRKATPAATVPATSSGASAGSRTATKAKTSAIRPGPAHGKKIPADPAWKFILKTGFGPQVVPLLTSLLPKSQPKGFTAPAFPEFPFEEPVIGPGSEPFPAFQPGLTAFEGRGVSSRACECPPKRKRGKRKARSVCYSGTYRELASGLRKSKRRKVPCQVSKRKPRSQQAR